MAQDPKAPPLEYLRQLPEQVCAWVRGRSIAGIALRRRCCRAELMVRFEGVASEFAQFDFGKSDVRLLDGSKERIHFARSKYSRWVWVVIVPTWLVKRQRSFRNKWYFWANHSRLKPLTSMLVCCAVTRTVGCGGHRVILATESSKAPIVCSRLLRREHAVAAPFAPMPRRIHRRQRAWNLFS